MVIETDHINQPEDDAMNYTTYNTTYNEGGEGYNPNAAKDEARAAARTRAAIEARIEHIDANIEKYRAAWAEAVEKVSGGAAGVTPAQLAEIEKMAGITLAEVKAAKARA